MPAPPNTPTRPSSVRPPARTPAPIDAAPAIRVVGLRKSYGDHRVLDGVDLTVESGTIFALLGPNGAGKTTIVRILSTLATADDGHATIAGFDLRTHPAAVRGAISLTGQSAAVDDFLTGEETLRMMARLLHLSPAAAKRRTATLLRQFDLADAGHQRVSTYSGGMRRRLDLAVSLVGRPPVIFLDEPTTGLDPRSRQALWSALRALSSEGTTIFLTTQYLEEADQLADRIAVIDDGRIVANGTADDLKRGVAEERVELTFRTTDDYERAATVMAEPDLTLDADRLVISAGTSDAATTLARLFDALAAAHIPLGSVEIVRPTLDDVFFALTTKEAA